MAAEFVTLKKCRGYSYKRPYAIAYFRAKDLFTWRGDDMPEQAVYCLFINVLKSYPYCGKGYSGEHSKERMAELFDDLKNSFRGICCEDNIEFNCYRFYLCDLVPYFYVFDTISETVRSNMGVAFPGDVEKAREYALQYINSKVRKGEWIPSDSDALDAYEKKKGYDRAYRMAEKYYVKQSDILDEIKSLEEKYEDHIVPPEISDIAVVNEKELGEMWDAVDAACYYSEEATGNVYDSITFASTYVKQAFFFSTGLKLREKYDVEELVKDECKLKKLYEDVAIAAFLSNGRRYKIMFCEVLANFEKKSSWELRAYESVFRNGLECEDVDAYISQCEKRKEEDREEWEREQRRSEANSVWLREAYGMAMESDWSASWNLDDQE